MNSEKTHKTTRTETLKIKVCGMKHNPDAVAALHPEYLGFIFWDGSSRFVGSPENLLEHPGSPVADQVPELVGVFVDAAPDYILRIVDLYALDMIQLHGDESPEYCQRLKDELEQRQASNPSGNHKVKIIKAFAVGNAFDFDSLTPFLGPCDFFLFDSRGPLPGGNGTRFKWELLKDYPFEKPFLLSGGISPDSLTDLKGFMNSEAAAFCMAIDVNSGFELRPGEKNTGALRAFMHEIRKSNKPLA
ncbi:phosphoribosylanthranilate isomerase [Robiginitalea myxolifaciens]|uniref:N-(5'-phosphoribosyl)anthranilate isomerase n=1 Tax=Robiginitalea myxolifaciens TaxID=400055 RepID=A0A1I6FP78_9FLAO|nr:phosphoribosylanthranilate isomerase [Robiginitalea myxolifaciens]SFR31726.1 phosphoribosylanthranilate isomerase [Robiginitalea myxolifaciens]